ncbi:MAG TPA: histidine triad nucleotide-binding protein [Anaerolineae bacterium]
MTHCVFCQIVSGEAPADIVYRGPGVTAFRDTRPQAPTHILVIPTRHLSSIGEMQPGDVDLVGGVIATAAKIAESEGLQQGYRLVINTGPQGGQSVEHLHVHLLGGRQMMWPPG